MNDQTPPLVVCHQGIYWTRLNPLLLTSVINGGITGLTKPDVLVPILEEAIFNEPLDSLIGPIETLHGHHLLWIKKRHIAEDSPE